MLNIASEGQTYYIGDKAYREKLNYWFIALKTGEKTIWDYELENDHVNAETDMDGDGDTLVYIDRGVSCYEPDGLTQKVEKQIEENGYSPDSDYWEILAQDAEFEQDLRNELINAIQDELDELDIDPNIRPYLK